MQRVVIVGGVLGFGSALVFAVAALTAAVFPNGTLVNGGWGASWAIERGVGIDAVPVPMQPQMVVDEGKNLEVPAVEVDFPDATAPPEPAG
jgi:hypothetical protein